MQDGKIGIKSRLNSCYKLLLSLSYMCLQMQYVCS